MGLRWKAVPLMWPGVQKVYFPWSTKRKSARVKGGVIASTYSWVFCEIVSAMSSACRLSARTPSSSAICPFLSSAQESPYSKNSTLNFRSSIEASVTSSLFEKA